MAKQYLLQHHGPNRATRRHLAFLDIFDGNSKHALGRQIAPVKRHVARPHEARRQHLSPNGRG
jgi:hypothetical protein